MFKVCEKNKVLLLWSVDLFFSYKGNLEVSTLNQAILFNITTASQLSTTKQVSHHDNLRVLFSLINLLQNSRACYLSSFTEFKKIYIYFTKLYIQFIFCTSQNKRQFYGTRYFAPTDLDLQIFLFLRYNKLPRFSIQMTPKQQGFELRWPVPFMRHFFSNKYSICVFILQIFKLSKC